MANEAIKALQQEMEEGEVRFDTTINAIDERILPTDDDLEGELPCGLKDVNGQIHRHYVIREMNGGDEEEITATSQRKPAKVANKLLELCVEEVGIYKKREMKKEDWLNNVIYRMTVGDQDFLLFKIRKVSDDAEIEVKHVCPNCKSKINTFFNIDELEFQPYTGDSTQERVFKLARGIKDDKGVVHNEIRMRLMNGLDREICLPSVKANPSKGSTIAFSRICQFTDGYPFNEHTLRQMLMKDRKIIERNNREMIDFGYITKVDVECQQCGYQFEAGLSNATSGNFI